MAESERWAHVRQLVNDGATLDINGGGYHLKIASLYQGEQQVCMFMYREMGFDKIMDRLEKLAKRYCDEGIVTDQVNGTEYCVW